MDNTKTIEAKICKVCGNEFASADKNADTCIRCKVIEEMKLPPDTIVNQNVLNIYLSKNFDKVKGVDKVYLTIAEGILLFDKKKKDKEKLYTRVKVFGKKSSIDIERYVKMCIRDTTTYKNNYDAMVFVKVSAVSDFIVFAVSLSDRLKNKLKDKDKLFVKNYIISLAVGWYFKKSR